MTLAGVTMKESYHRAVGSAGQDQTARMCRLK